MVEDLARDAVDRRRDPRPLLWPLAIFAILALLFAFALRSGDPSKLPSALIGKPVPESLCGAGRAQGRQDPSAALPPPSLPPAK